jgi:hypothetical protein
LQKIIPMTDAKSPHTDPWPWGTIYVRAKQKAGGLREAILPLSTTLSLI